MKLTWKNKLRSGALQFTIFISVIIALILAGIILLAYTHGFFIEQSKASVDNIKLADSGISALQLQNKISNDTIIVNIPETREGQIIKTHLSHWGIFEKGFVETVHRTKKFKKCSLLGTGKIVNRPALYLKETYKPLAVVGNTEILGNAFLPEQGVRPGNISGNSYYGTKLIYGTVMQSSTELPKLKYDYKQLLNYYLEDYQPVGLNNIISPEQGKTINSFTNPVQGYYNSGAITLENISLYGNIIIRSGEKITVKKTADLRDIILAAPVVVIEDGVAGNFQAIASNYIKTGKDCLLTYPSALVLVEKEDIIISKDDIEFSNKISVNEGSVIKGSICFFKTNPENDFKVNIFISERSSVKGEVFCEGNLELRGAVKGTVYTGQFITNEGGTVFVNHLYNAYISNEGFPEQFGGILFEDESKSVMKWLY